MPRDDTMSTGDNREFLQSNPEGLITGTDTTDQTPTTEPSSSAISNSPAAPVQLPRTRSRGTRILLDALMRRPTRRRQHTRHAADREPRPAAEITTSDAYSGTSHGTTSPYSTPQRATTSRKRRTNPVDAELPSSKKSRTEQDSDSEEKPSKQDPAWKSFKRWTCFEQSRETDPGFKIFEDETATEAKNPTSEEIGKDASFSDLRLEDGLEQAQRLLRLETKRIVQNAGLIYGLDVVKSFLPLAKELDIWTPHLKLNLETRLRSWELWACAHRETGAPPPRGASPDHVPGEDEYWLTVEAIEELRVVIDDVEKAAVETRKAGNENIGLEENQKYSKESLQLLAGYCMGGSAGMVTGDPELAKTDEKEFYSRQTVAWAHIVHHHLDICFSTLGSELLVDKTWQETLRQSVMKGTRQVNFATLEHFWEGERYPPWGFWQARRFGGLAKDPNCDRGDPEAKLMFEAGVDGWDNH